MRLIRLLIFNDHEHINFLNNLAIKDTYQSLLSLDDNGNSLIQKSQELKKRVKAHRLNLTSDEGDVFRKGSFKDLKLGKIWGVAFFTY